MEHRITFSEETERDIKMIIDEFGYDSEEEFVEEAVNEDLGIEKAGFLKYF